jgi:hypothetical protein
LPFEESEGEGFEAEAGGCPGFAVFYVVGEGGFVGEFAVFFVEDPSEVGLKLGGVCAEFVEEAGDAGLLPG